MHECEVCGEPHDEQTHGEPETVLQPSLHRLEEYADMVIDEAESRGIAVADLESDLDENGEDAVDDVIVDALERIQAAGYPVLEADDTLLIYPIPAAV